MENTEIERLKQFIRENAITEVECMVPDMSGIARGKIIPAEKFLRILEQHRLPLPESVFLQTVTGDYPEDYDSVAAASDGDIYMVPDPDTIRIVPWYQDPAAQIICDAIYTDGTPVDISSRYILRHVLELYDEKGWKPVVAPELEFYLVDINRDPDLPLEPPIGRSGRRESGRQAYGIDAVNEFDPFFEDVYDYCDKQNIDIDNLLHESGAAQIEINFNHGDPVELADQAFLFKRTVRQVAILHGIYATFMAQPMQKEPGSAMHIHQSVVDAKTGKNLFATDDNEDTPQFLHYIGGLQKYLTAAMLLLAPNVNSYRRFGHRNTDSPINILWAHDNRTAGFRVPMSSPSNRRVENRVVGADANPYLAIAATLACGYLGMVEEIEPSDPIDGSAYNRAHTLPRHQFDAIRKLRQCRPLKDIFGDRFIDALTVIKEAEFEAYHAVISSWEREFLLLNV